MTLSQLRTFGKQFIPATTMLIVLIYTLYWQKLTINQWVEQFSWLPYAALSIAGIFAVQFGRSRIVYCALALLFMLLSPAADLQADPGIIIGLGMTLSWLLWRIDKGLLPINIGYSAAEMALVFGAAYLLLTHFKSVFRRPFSRFLSIIVGTWWSGKPVIHPI